MAGGVATPNPLGAASSTHYGQRRMRLVWSKSAGGTNSCIIYNHCVNNGYTQQSTGALSMAKKNATIYNSPFNEMVMVLYFSFPFSSWGDRFQLHVLNQNLPPALQIVK